MTSKNRDMWDAVNNRIAAAVKNTTTLQEIKSFTRGFRIKTLDGIEKPALFTHLAESSDTYIDNQHRQEQFNLRLILVMDIPEGEGDYIGDLIELRDKILNAIENDSSGNQDITIGNQLHRALEIIGNEVSLSDSGNSVMSMTTYQVSSYYYSPGAR